MHFYAFAAATFDPLPDWFQMLQELSRLVKTRLSGLWNCTHEHGHKDSQPTMRMCDLQMHLFDIDIPGKITFRESDTLTAGQNVSVVDTEVGRIGLGICYDIRFPELAMIYARQGVQLILYPGTANMPPPPPPPTGRLVRAGIQHDIRCLLPQAGNGVFLNLVFRDMCFRLVVLLS